MKMEKPELLTSSRNNGEFYGTPFLHVPDLSSALVHQPFLSTAPTTNPCHPPPLLSWHGHAAYLPGSWGCNYATKHFELDRLETFPGQRNIGLENSESAYIPTMVSPSKHSELENHSPEPDNVSKHSCSPTDDAKRTSYCPDMNSVAPVLSVEGQDSPTQRSQPLFGPHSDPSDPSSLVLSTDPESATR